MRRRITPDAQRIANQIATLMIISFPHFASPVAIITPATMIRIKDATNITLISIFTKAVTNTGNAVVSVIVDPDD